MIHVSKHALDVPSESQRGKIVPKINYKNKMIFKTLYLYYDIIKIICFSITFFNMILTFFDLFFTFLFSSLILDRI